MKKFLTAALVVLAVFFAVSCSDGAALDDLIDTGSTNPTDQTDTSDTNADTADSNADSGDDSATDTGDSNDSDNTETSDTDISDSENNSDDDSADSEITADNDDSADTNDSDDNEVSDIDAADSGNEPDNDSDPADSGSDADSTDSGNDSDNDSADSDNDGDPADSGNDNDADNPETPESDCIGISIDWDTFVLYEGAFSADATIGNMSLPDGFSIEFDHNSNGKVNVGQYDLGSSQNRQYHTCKECVMVYMDCEVPYVFYPDNCASYFFQERGTLNITANDDSTDKEGNIEGTLSAKLIEVELSGTEYDIYSTPVANGRCVEIESGGTFQSTKDCREITLGRTLTYNSSDKRYETSYSPNTGNFLKNDTFTMQVRNISTGEYGLAGTNFGNTNGIFFVVYEDNGSGIKLFQKSGTVNVTSYNASNKKISAELKDVILEEVTISGGSSTKVPYGACLKVKDTTLSY